MTLLYRDDNNFNVQLIPLWSYKQFFYNSDISSEILKNIWLFIPLGTSIYKITSMRRLLLICIVLSVAIEITQFFTHVGFCELDDVISNSLGGLIGFTVGKLTDSVRVRINSWKHIHIAKRR